MNGMKTISRNKSVIKMTERCIMKEIVRKAEKAAAYVIMTMPCLQDEQLKKVFLMAKNELQFRNVDLNELVECQEQDIRGRQDDKL